MGIDLGLFFLIPNSGDAIVTFGTPGDPSDDEWNHVREIVTADRAADRSGWIARDAEQWRVDHLRSLITTRNRDSGTGSSRRSTPMSAPALQQAGEESE